MDRLLDRDGREAMLNHDDDQSVVARCVVTPYVAAGIAFATVEALACVGVSAGAVQNQRCACVDRVEEMESGMAWRGVETDVEAAMNFDLVRASTLVQPPPDSTFLLPHNAIPHILQVLRDFQSVIKPADGPFDIRFNEGTSLKHGITQPDSFVALVTLAAQASKSGGDCLRPARLCVFGLTFKRDSPCRRQGPERAKREFAPDCTPSNALRLTMDQSRYSTPTNCVVPFPADP
ncbi:uncharacterized protein IWZ02DRAFT_430576 [Phyllosticta citriasiana]|uniref:uncharacterized protein n=1 Tax=Phyllosticta citriasiana TaxID=595635 RepID=UPI0030FD459C